MNDQAIHSDQRSRIVHARRGFDDRHGQYRFGPFVAKPASRDLFCNGERICIGSRAFDLLVLLLCFQGEIVAKEDIFQSVWPSTTVDESNLRFQMATLRKALGSERDRIKTIPGRGYLFVGDETKPIPATTPDNLLPDEQTRNSSAIVIIDHDPANREALRRLLRPFHAAILSFGSFEAFLESSMGASLTSRRPHQTPVGA